MRQKNMNAEKNPVFFLLALISVVFLVATIVSAAPLGNITKVEVDGFTVTTAGPNPAIAAGDEIAVRVEFTSLVNISDVTVNAKIEGNKKDVEAETRAFDVETGQNYAKSVKLLVPVDLKDTLSGTVDLTIEVSGAGGFKTTNTYTLRVQRSSYDAEIKSIVVPQTIKAGDSMPIDVVLKNLGYNDLNDVYVTAKISALGIERTDFFGDIVALECNKDATSLVNYGVNITRKCNENDQDTVNGRLFLQVPFDAKSGTYSLDITVSNDDTVTSQTVQVMVKNSFSNGNFIVSGNQLLIVNPTNEVVVYRLIPETSSTASVSVSESLVAVPAGASKAVTVDATSSTAGNLVYSVNVFSTDGSLVNTLNFSKTVTENSGTSPIVVLTVVLGIVFLVLLVVLIVLIGKKPEKEEFGESYY